MQLDRLVLIGSGNVMVHAARVARARGIPADIVLAPRHTPTVPPTAAPMDVPVWVIPDINAPGTAYPCGPGALALCFGPAWIFSPAVRASFGLGMINYNAIPVPRYSGGAHYTWQILFGDRQGGAVLQRITEDLDSGPVLYRSHFAIPYSARTPADYARVYDTHGYALIDSAFTAEFEFPDEQPYDHRSRVYWPRLLTAKNAWIDWSWTGREIERFCNAFDEPYEGAGTLVGGRELRLKNVAFLSSSGWHPYTSGLVYHVSSEFAWIAVREGSLRVPQQDLVEGQRLATPPGLLHSAMTFHLRLDGAGPK